MFTDFRGRSVIVTGGSKGIGRGLARKFAKHGALVTVAARHMPELQAVVDEIRSLGGIARATVCDITDWASVQNLVDEAAASFSGIDVMCTNAGIFPQARMNDLTPEEWDFVMSTNLKGAFLCVKASIPHFERKAGGRVVITSSITGPITGYPGWTHYGASKAGQLGFLKSAAMELARYGATINAVMPGNILTEGLEGLGEEYLKNAAAGIPLKRLGSVDDVANAALFLASSEAAYITGQTIVVDGGQTLPETVDAVAAL